MYAHFSNVAFCLRLTPLQYATRCWMYSFVIMDLRLLLKIRQLCILQSLLDQSLWQVTQDKSTFSSTDSGGSLL